jgi:hypothetical protein
MEAELHVSADDLAVAAAKEKLAALATRPGYREAMKPRATGSKRAAMILFLTGVAFFGLALGSCTYVSAMWVRWIMSGVFVLLGLFAWLLGIGASPDPLPQTWPVVVLAKQPEHRLSVLRDTGETVTVTTNDALHAIVRTGDVGVAHVRAIKHATPPLASMIAFHRL